LNVVSIATCSEGNIVVLRREPTNANGHAMLYDYCRPSLGLKWVQTKPGTCNVELEVEEKRWYAYSASTQVGVDGTVTGNITGRLRNLTGNCEHHSLTLGHGRPTFDDTETEMTYRLRFPRVYGHAFHAQTSVHQLFQNCQADSSYTERLRGFNFDIIEYDQSSAFLIARTALGIHSPIAPQVIGSLLRMGTASSS
jgi:hypothetical protein